MWNPYPIFISLNHLAVKITRPSFSFGCICINSSTCLILSWIDELMKEWMNTIRWMNGYERDGKVNGGMNEWTSSEQKIYILWVNIEWMSWWMSQNSRWCEWTSKYNAVFFFFFFIKRHQPREQSSLNPVWCEVTYWWLTDNCSPHHRPLNFENSVLLF